jgi:hypothetical protein
LFINQVDIYSYGILEKVFVFLILLNSLDNSKHIGDVVDAVDAKSENMVYKMEPKNLILNAIFEQLDSQYQE